MLLQSTAVGVNGVVALLHAVSAVEVARQTILHKGIVEANVKDRPSRTALIFHHVNCKICNNTPYTFRLDDVFS